MEITWSTEELREHVAWLIKERLFSVTMNSAGPIRVTEILMSDDDAARLTVVFDQASTGQAVQGKG